MGDNSRKRGKQGAMKADWVIPSLVMSAGLLVAAYLLMAFTSYSGSNLFGLWVWWIVATFTAAMVMVFVQTVRLAVKGVERPTQALMDIFHGDYWLRSLGGPCLAGFNLVTFMWIKPELNAVAPFWADPLLADLDHMLFGRDAWHYFTWMDLQLLGITYNLVWLLALAAMVFWLFHRPPSIERSKSIVSFFFLWSVFGPIGQFVMPAAGPIFYERIGLGDRFTELVSQLAPATHHIADYLWENFTAKQLAPGAGISAMPSMHIATAVWIVLSCRKTSLFWPSVLFGMYLFVGSIALGWHYAVDGIAGGVGAVFAYWVSPLMLNFHANWKFWDEAKLLKNSKQ